MVTWQNTTNMRDTMYVCMNKLKCYHHDNIAVYYKDIHEFRFKINIVFLTFYNFFVHAFLFIGLFSNTIPGTNINAKKR